MAVKGAVCVCTRLSCRCAHTGKSIRGSNDVLFLESIVIRSQLERDSVGPELCQSQHSLLFARGLYHHQSVTADTVIVNIWKVNTHGCARRGFAGFSPDRKLSLPWFITLPGSMAQGNKQEMLVRGFSSMNTEAVGSR